MADLGSIWTFTLTEGNSDNPRNGACVMDAVSWFKYGQLGDQPMCTCPIQAAFARRMNDVLPDLPRQGLKNYIFRFVDTVDPEAEIARVEYLMWRMVRVFLASSLEAYGFPGVAKDLREATSFEGAVQAVEYVPGVVSFAPVMKGVIRRFGSMVRNYESGHLAAAGDEAALLMSYACKAIWTVLGANSDIYDEVWKTLDGLLAIGRQAPPLDVPAIAAAIDSFVAAAEAG